MKLLKIIFLAVFVFMTSSLFACKISCKIQNPLAKYKVGDELVVLVDVQLVHHSCSVAMNQTKFDYSGVKILGATKWKEHSTMHFTRKLKVIVLDNSDKHLISIVRNCSNGGGKNVLLIPVK